MQVFVGIGYEALAAAPRAKVIGLTVVLRMMRYLGWIDLHSTHGVDYQGT